MTFLRNNWFRLGFIVFCALAFGALFYAEHLSFTQKLLLASLMALPLHQFEEYQFPGGGPVVINRYFYGERDDYLTYPGNWNSIMVVNLSAYVFYLAALALPEVVWLGVATMFFNLYQVLGHCVQMNMKMRTWYNPGMATSVLLFLPISLAYLCHVVSAGLMTGTAWVLALAAFVLMAAMTVIAPVQGLKKRNSKHRIPSWQAERLERVRSFCAVGARNAAAHESNGESKGRVL